MQPWLLLGTLCFTLPLLALSVMISGVAGESLEGTGSWEAVLLARRRRPAGDCVPGRDDDGGWSMNVDDPSADCYMDLRRLGSDEA